MKGTWISYSVAELAWIEERKALSRRALHILFVIEFRRSDVTLDHLKHLCQRKGWKTGRTGCYPKGAVPGNKGKPCAPGTGGKHPNARKTQFKKGALPANTKFAGYERIDERDGYVYLSVNETNPHTGFARRFVLKHKYLWEQKHGPVPEGHCLKSRNGIRTNTDPDNWFLIPRAMLPRLAGRWGTNYDSAPAELKPTIFAIAKLETKARDKGKRAAK